MSSKIIIFIIMMNVLSCSTLNPLILTPVKAMVSIPALQKFLEFRKNGRLWPCTTTTRTRDAIDLRLGHFKTPYSSLAHRFYNFEAMPRRPNLTDVHTKHVKVKRAPLKDSFGNNLFIHRCGIRYTFYPMNWNALRDRNLYFPKEKRSSSVKKINKNISIHIPLIRHKNEVLSKQKQILSPMKKTDPLLMGLCGRTVVKIDPKIQQNRTAILEKPKKFVKPKREGGIIRIKVPSVQNIASCGSSYPGCYIVNHRFWPLLGRYEMPNRSKRHKRSQLSEKGHELPADVMSWPRLGSYSQVAELHSAAKGAHIKGGILGSFSPFFDGRRKNQMLVISRLSEMKAKEHIANDNRRAQMHKTQEAKREFQERIAEQLGLLSEAKRADLRAKRAFDKVVKLERGLSEQDREIHRLKEAEDTLYEELLETEAEVAMADIELIPNLLTEEDLQEFMTGTRVV